MIKNTRKFLNADDGMDATTGASDHYEGTAPDWSKLAGGLEDDPQPEPEKEAPKEEEKPKDESKPPSETVEAPKVEEPKKEDDSPKTEEKPVEEKNDEKKEELPEVPETDEDIDNLKVDPKASQNVRKQVKEMKALIKDERAKSRTYKQKLQEFQTQLEQIKSESGKLPEDVKKELEELRAEKQKFLLDQDPGFNQQYEEKLQKHESEVLDFLVNHPALKLPSDKAEEIKKIGFDKVSPAFWNQVVSLINDPFLKQKVTNMIIGRDSIIEERDKKKAEIAQNREAWLSQKSEEEKKSQEQWNQAASTRLQELAKGSDWASEKDIPPNATPEQKKAIEDHNKQYQDNLKKFHGVMMEVVGKRDPYKTSETLFKAFEHPMLKEKLDKLQKELEAEKARSKQLEDRIAGSRNASKISSVETARTDIKPDAPKIGTTADEAIDKFFASRG